MLDLSPRRTRVAALASKFVAVLIESPRSVNSCLRTIRASFRELILRFAEPWQKCQFSDSLRKKPKEKGIYPSSGDSQEKQGSKEKRFILLGSSVFYLLAENAEKNVGEDSKNDVDEHPAANPRP